MIRLRAFVASLALVALMPARAAAQPADDDPDRRAFQAGLACFDEKRYPCAIDAWEGLVERVGPARAWKVLYNLGIAHDEQGDATRALDRWESFLEHAPPGEAREQRAAAQARIDKLRARFGELVVPAPTGAAGTVRVGAGRERAAGFRVLVAPGTHALVLTRPGRPDVKVSIDIAAGEKKSVDWPADASSPSPSPQPAPQADKPPPSRSAAPTILAVGFGVATAASIALPIGLGVAAGDTRDDAAAATDRDAYDRAVADYEDQKTLYGVSYALPAVLAAATIGFVIWAVTADDGATARAPSTVVHF